MTLFLEQNMIFMLVWDNLKKPEGASEGDVFELATLRYMNFLYFSLPFCVVSSLYSSN